MDVYVGGIWADWLVWCALCGVMLSLSEGFGGKGGKKWGYEEGTEAYVAGDHP